MAGLPSLLPTPPFLSLLPAFPQAAGTIPSRDELPPPLVSPAGPPGAGKGSRAFPATGALLPLRVAIWGPLSIGILKHVSEENSL
jgi:hypothetical protein